MTEAVNKLPDLSEADRRLLELAAEARDLSATSDHAAALDVLERVLDGIAEL